MSTLETFVGLTCPVCERPKPPNTAVCRKCYRELPAPLRSALWQRFGEGFEEAFDKAVKYLKDRGV